MPEAGGDRRTTLESLRAVLASWRLLSVALLSFASGLPLGLVWIAIPTWMATVGVDIKVIGLFTLAQAPWTFKVLWAPLMDRFPLPVLGRKRGYILATQALLLLLGLWLAAASGRPDAVRIGIITLAIAFASATQDVAYDAYTVEVLRREEQGPAVGARVAMYRAAMWLSGRLTITAAGWVGWPIVNAITALVYVPATLVTWRAPEPESVPEPPRTLRAAVFEPFLGLLAQHRALEILAFVVLFKLSDLVTQSLIGPFLVQKGYDAVDVGVAAGTVSLFTIVGGTFLGGILTQTRGLGPALWISGFLQLFSNLGYAVVAQIGVNRPVMYAAQGFEYLCSGLGNGAFGVLLLRLTQKRFSATQYALLSSLFSIPRVVAGPPAGLLADALGWRDFYVSTLAMGVPGLLMLQRFVPWGVREPEFGVAEPATGPRLAPRAILARASVVFVAFVLLAAGSLAFVSAIKDFRAGRGFDALPALLALARPVSLGDWVSSAGVVAAAAVAALGTAAALAVRRRPE
ncbi:MAG TPA: MFS transporter [Vicinamibacteria bacterium]|nr:MFS transporter [Vicinamibacteria bacterium]